MKSFTTFAVFGPIFALLAPKQAPLFFWISCLALLGMATPAIGQTTQMLNTPGTHTVTVPPDAVGARVVVRGGGGAAMGDPNGQNMKGAGGGGYAHAFVAIAPGTASVTVQVGAGGNTGDGATSWFGSSTHLYANGGTGNTNGGMGGTAGGDGAVLFGLESLPGANGDLGYPIVFPGDAATGGNGGNGGGPGGGAGGAGAGGLFGPPGGQGAPGQAPGGGGGGISGIAVGGDGLVEVIWLNSTEWQQQVPPPGTTFNTPGSYMATVPPNIVGARVVVRGGGGGVQGNESGNAAGGGGYARAYIGIVPGTPTTMVHVGAGGYGGDGATSWFGNSALLYANGGRSNLNGGTGASGGGSSAALGLVTFTGGNGTQGTIGFFPGDPSIGGFGGNGAGPNGGIGGIGESPGGLNTEGQAPGGGSGGRFSGTGAGGAGRVEITWLNSTQWEQEAPSLCTNPNVVGTAFVSPSCVSGPTLVTVSSSSHDGDSNAYLYEWQQSSTPDFSANVSPVPNATPAGFTLQVNTTTYFRRKVTFLGFGTVCYTNHVRTLIYAGPVHVNVQAPTDGDGTSWATARNDLQKAIYEKCPHQNEIWVAGGVYRPTIPPTNITDPADNAFFVNINVTLYGGFAGTETSLSQRVLGAHPTILTGDLGNGDTTYHVLLLQNNPILDGFTIRNGRAKGAGNLYVASKELARNRGGGIYLVEGAPLLRNCLLTNNRATNGGGGAYSESLGSYNFQHCTISNNQAGAGGGGIDSYYGFFSVVQNCTIADNVGDEGGGIHSANLTLSNSNIRNNRSRLGGGVFTNANNSTVILRNNVFEGNHATVFGGAYHGLKTAYSQHDIFQNLFLSNTTGNLGGACYMATVPEVYFVDGYFSLRQNTFFGNAAAGGGGAFKYEAPERVQLFNNVFSQNRFGNAADVPGADVYAITQANQLSAQHAVSNNHFQVLPGTISAAQLYNKGNLLNLNGLFADATQPAGPDGTFGNADDGLRPAANCSPIVNAGILISDNTSDLTGAARVQMGFTDMGAYESAADHLPIFKITGPSSGQAVVLTVQPTSGNNASYLWNGGLTPNAVENTFVNAGTYMAKVTATLPNGCSRADSVQISICGRRYVNATAPAGGDGASWATAFNNLDDALAYNASGCGPEIWVAAGTYRPCKDHTGNSNPADPRRKTFLLPAGVKLYGGFTGNETSIEGRDVVAHATVLSGDIGTAGTDSDNCYHVALAIAPNSNSLLDGLRIEGGRANGSGQFSAVSLDVLDSQGAGLYVTNGAHTLRQVTIRDNHSTFGGGGLLSFANSLHVERSSFIANAASSGAGVFASGVHLTLTNSVLLNNTATGSGSGLFLNAGNASVTGNTIVANNSGAAGAVRLESGQTLLANNLFWANAFGGNDQQNDADVSKQHPATATFQHNLLQLPYGNYALGGTELGNVFGVMPQFVNLANPAGSDGYLGSADDGLRLADCSPAINGGGAAWAGTGSDRAGAMRVQGPGVDIGAYEAPENLRSGGGVYLSGATEGNVEISLTVSGGTAYSWSTGANPNAATNVIGQSGLHTVSVALANGCTQVVPFRTLNNRYFVKAGNPAGGDGRSWATAFATLYEALAQPLMPGVEIWMAGGNYPVNAGSHVIIQKNDVNIYGGFAGTEARLSQRQLGLYTTSLIGDNAHYALRVTESNNLRLNGLRFAGGGGAVHVRGAYSEVRVDNPCPQPPCADGYRYFVYNDHLEIRHCVVEGQSAGVNALDLAFLSDVTLDSSRLENNGRALNLSNLQKVTIRDNHFLNNTGGAAKLDIWNAQDAALVQRNTFTNNHSDYGGAVRLRGESSRPDLEANANADIAFNTFENNGASVHGGAIYCSGRGTRSIQRNVFRGNTAQEYGGAVTVLNDGTTERNFFLNNTAQLGGALYGGGSVEVNVFSGNHATERGGAFYGTQQYWAIANTFFDNRADEFGGAIFSDYGNLFTTNYALLLENIFWENKRKVGGNYVANVAEADVAKRTVSAAPNVFYNLFQIAESNYDSYIRNESSIEDALFYTNGFGNIFGFDPLFTNPQVPAGQDGQLGTSDDGLRLQPGSAAIDGSEVITAGSIRSSPSSDITGAPRPQGAKKDMGAYEGSCGTLAFVSLYNSRSASNNVTICAGDNLVFAVTANFAVSYQWKRNGVPIGTNSPTLFLNPVTMADAGTYTVTILGCNGGPITPSDIVVSVVPGQPILYVNHQAAPGGNGTSWATAFQHLQDALDVANICTNVQEIWVASGTHKPNKPFGATESAFGVFAHFYVRDGLKLYGGFAGTEGAISERNLAANNTTLSGDFNGDDDITGSGATLAIANNFENAFNVLVASTPANGVGITLDGFTIRGGNARCSGCSPFAINDNTLTYTNGAGLQIVGGQNTLRNLTLVGNSSYSGGGGAYFKSGSGSLSHSTLTLNRSEFVGGAGAFIDNASYTIEQNTATDNRTDNNGGGGALRISNTSTNLIGNTFAGNAAGTGGGGGVEILGGTVTMQNNTFSANRSNGDGGGLKMSNAQNAALNDNTFLDNSADAGGGLYISGTVALHNNTIRNNTIKAGVGGGLAFLGGGPLTLMRNLIQSNTTGGFGRGGGVYLSGGAITAERNFVVGNTAGGGGGLFLESLPSSRLRNNVIAGNSTLNSALGGGLYIDRNAPDNEVVNTTFYGNTGFSGGGLSTGGSNITVRLLNTVFFGNTATGGAPDIHNFNNSATVQVQYSLLQLANAAAYHAGAFNTIAPGFGMKYGQNPLFTASADLDGPDNIFGTTDDGLTLQNGSPAINAGTTPAPPIPTDIAGNTRQGAYDLGAYEVTCAPAVFTVGGGGPLCTGQSTMITLSGSQTGATYQLKQNGANTGSPVAGTGSALGFSVNQPGVYTIVATNTSNGCASDMAGSATAGVAAPAGSIAIEENSGQTPNDGIVCPGGTAILTASGGVSYSWSTGATMAAITALGGTYTVFVTDANGCFNIASASISETPIAVFNVGGTGNATVTLSGSETGGRYQLLYLGADIFQIGTPTPVGAVLDGTGSGLSFTAPSEGIYSVRVTHVASGCQRDMAGQIAVTNLLSSGGCSSGTISVLENSGTVPNDGIICSGPVTLTAPECSLYEWSNGAVTRQITVSPAMTTTYSVMVTSDNNSTSTYFTTIVVAGASIAFNTCPDLSMPVEVSAGNGQAAAIAEYIVAADNATHYTYLLSGAMSGGGNGTGSGLLFNLGITGVTISATNGCAVANTPCLVEVRVTDGSPNCPTLSPPGDVQITNATCNAQCVATGGNIIAPAAGCPSGSTLQYSVNGGAWSSTLPEYDQDGPAQTIKTRCICDIDATIVSTESSGVTTVLADCTDTQAPSVSCPPNTTVLNTDVGNSCSITIPNYVTMLTAIDNCSEVVENQSIPAGSYASGVSDGATVTVNYTATDGASPANTKTCTVVITVADNIPPTIACPGNQQVPGTLNGNVCQAMASGANAEYGDNCSNFSLGYVLSGAMTGSGNGQVSGLSFPLGLTTVVYTVTDAAQLRASCSFTVTVLPCQTAFSGRIIWKQDNVTGVKDVNVAIGGDQTGTTTSNTTGHYNLTLAVGNNFTITPTKNTNKLNGVNASDAARIQQHLSGNPITNPWQLIAADVNSNNAISALDANIIQLSLLGNPSALQQFVKSWRFVPTTHALANPPWGFPEQIAITGATGDQTGKDFYGIKVGDVAAIYANPANGGTGAPFVLHTPDQVLEAGRTLSVEFAADALSDIAALQFALRFDPTQLQLANIATLNGLPLSSDNFGTYEAEAGSVRMVWAGLNPVALKQTAPVFRLTFTVLESGSRLSEVLGLDDATLPGHVYNSLSAESDVSLRFDASTAVGNLLGNGQVQLLQNRPNPFVRDTRIGFILPESCEAHLRIFDAAGRLVTERTQQYPAGRHDESFDLSGVSGLFYYELTTPFGVLAKKMTKVE